LKSSTHRNVTCWIRPSRSSKGINSGQQKNETELKTKNLKCSWKEELQLWSSLFSKHGSGSSSCSFSHINNVNCLGVPRVEWKIIISSTKLHLCPSI